MPATKAIGQDKATGSFEDIAEGQRLGCRLGSGVDHPGPDLCVPGLESYQFPFHEPCFTTLQVPFIQNALGGGDVLAEVAPTQL